MKKIFYSLNMMSPNPNDWKTSLFPSDFIIPLEKYCEEKYYGHTSCPAWKAWTSNVWTFRQPFDVELQFESSTNRLYSNLEQDLFNNYIYTNNDWLDGPLPVVQLCWSILFWTDEKNVWIEQIPDPNLSRVGLELISASFPISVWTRPVVTAFKILDLDKKIILERGTPLCNIRFYSDKNNDKFILEQKDPPQKVIDNLSKDSEVKRWQKNYSWSLINKRLDKQSKCPFSRWWK